MELLRQIVAVAAVLGLACWLVWILRKKGWAVGVPTQSGKARRLQLLERLPLTTTHSLHLVRAGPRTLLLAVHSSGIRLLCEVRDADQRET